MSENARKYTVTVQGGADVPSAEGGGLHVHPLEVLEATVDQQVTAGGVTGTPGDLLAAGFLSLHTPACSAGEDDDGCGEEHPVHVEPGKPGQGVE